MSDYREMRVDVFEYREMLEQESCNPIYGGKFSRFNCVSYTMGLCGVFTEKHWEVVMCLFTEGIVNA